MSKRLIELASRVRRRVRDPEIIDLCDEALRVATQPNDNHPRPVAPVEKVTKGFDKKTYMRNYMRNRRAKTSTADRGSAS